MFKTYNLTTVTGPAGANSEEQVGRKLVVEAVVSMEVDMAWESKEMSLPFRSETSFCVLKTIWTKLQVPVTCPAAMEN